MVDPLQQRLDATEAMRRGLLQQFTAGRAAAAKR